jgi:transposase
MPRKSSVRTVTTIGIDMGKTTLHMIGLDSSVPSCCERRSRVGRIASRLANLPSSLIGIEGQQATMKNADRGCQKECVSRFL